MLIGPFVVGNTVGDRVCVFASIWGLGPLGETCVDMRGRELEWKVDSGIRVWVWDGVRLGGDLVWWEWNTGVVKWSASGWGVMGWLR